MDPRWSRVRTLTDSVWWELFQLRYDVCVLCVRPVLLWVLIRYSCLH